MTAGPVLGVLVPCRNEATVIRRKLANLAAQRWPAAPRPHRLVVVDDESDDGTAEFAREALASFDATAVLAAVVPNDVRPGKPGALAAGLRRLGGAVDVVVLTDADVVLEQGSLAALAAAFAGSTPPGMVCGRQRFVRSLADDGTPRAADGGPLADAGGWYDRITARIRSAESRAGLLFSVHGQLLAWRADLPLAPTAGLAADDIDLRCQVRATGAAVRLASGACFLEVKSAPDGPGRAQALRRARAWFQVMEHCGPSDDASRLERVQWAFYRRVPGAAPLLALAGALALPLAGALLRGAAGAVAAAGLLALLALSPPGRRLVALLRIIAQSRRAESVAPLPDRWEMARR